LAAIDATRHPKLGKPGLETSPALPQWLLCVGNLDVLAVGLKNLRTDPLYLKQLLWRSEIAIQLTILNNRLSTRQPYAIELGGQCGARLHD
jgi:hypothetical protein